MDHIEALWPHIANMPNEDKCDTAHEPRMPQHIPISPLRQSLTSRCENVVTEDPRAKSDPRTIRGTQRSPSASSRRSRRCSRITEIVIVI